MLAVALGRSGSCSKGIAERLCGYVFLVCLLFDYPVVFVIIIII